MVQAFGHNLQNSLGQLNLVPSMRNDLQSDLVKLGGLEAPAHLDAGTTAMIRADIAQAFIFGFRLIMVIFAGLAMASAAIATRTIPSARREVNQDQS